MSASAISTYLKHGITRNQLASMCINLWKIPSDYQDLLDTYQLRSWNGNKFASEIHDGSIEFGASKTKYLVVYKETTPSQVCKASQIQLSFRAPLEEYGIPPYVLVRIVESYTDFTFSPF